MRMIFKTGDIIHQTKDNIVFLISDVDKDMLTLEYFDTVDKKHKSFSVSRKSIVAQFEDRSEFLIHFKVSKSKKLNTDSGKCSKV